MRIVGLSGFHVDIQPVLVDVSVYDTKPVHFLLICCNSIDWVQKTYQVYDPKT